MPNTVNQVRRSEVLTNFAVRFRPPARRWDQIFRILPVTQRNGEYPQFDADLYAAPDDFRADGTESKPVDIGWKYVAYQANAHALKTKITKNARKAAKNQVDLESIKVQGVKAMVENNMEKAVFGPGGILRTAANNIYSANVDWTNLATATPRVHIQTAGIAIKKACGYYPNTIAATAETFLQVVNTNEFKDATRFFTDLTKVNGIPDKLYGLDTIVVDSQVQTTKKGQAKIPSNFLMGDDVWIGYVAEGEPGEEILDDGGQAENQIGPEVMTYGVCINESEESRMWWDNDIQADWAEYERVYDLKVVARECGGLLQSVLSS